MLDYANMASMPRHGHIASSFFANIFSLFKSKEVYALQEQHALVFFGRKWSNEARLVDVARLEDPSEFRALTIEELDFVQPDFFMFSKNPYLQSPSTQKTAGVPDLVVEVWSRSNTPEERAMKQCIYSSHPACEHWYIQQDSNKVECWLGKNEQKPQLLTNVLVTRQGTEFDLRYLAL